MRPLNLIFLLLLILFSGICAAQELEVGRPEKADLSKSIVVYPNPAIDFVNVKLTEFNAHDAKVKLYNILGNEIPTETELNDFLQFEADMIYRDLGITEEDENEKDEEEVTPEDLDKFAR